jgi:predicted ATPase
LEYQPEDSPALKLQKLETLLASCPGTLPDAVPLLATLFAVPLDDRSPPLTLTPARQRQRTLETLLAVLRGLAAHQPVLLIMEDLHWVDPSTLELLGLLVAQAATAHLYVLLTWRPEFQPPWPPPAHQTTLTLGRLLPAQVAQLATQVAGGKLLPLAVLEQLVLKTEGVPLFVEELTQMVLASGLVREEGEHYALTGPLPPLAIPPTVQDSLVARLEQLGEAKAVAQVGAVWGRGFTEAQLQAVAPVDWWQLDQAVARLVEADILRELPLPPRLTYVFKHALLQEAAYASLPLDRRQQVHGQVAQVLAERFPETVATQPELLAHHYTEAGLGAHALEYWRRAGERANQRWAFVEASHHLTKGLEVLRALPEPLEDVQHELTLQIALLTALRATKGFAAPEVGQVCTRARELCQQVGESPQLLEVLLGLSGFYLVRGELHTALTLGEECRSLAQRLSHAAGLLSTNRRLGITCLHGGAFVQAREHFAQGLRLYNPSRPPVHPAMQEPGLACFTYGALALWFLGYPAQAWHRMQEALTLVQASSDPFGLAYALHIIAAMLHQCLGEGQAVQAHARAAMDLSRKHDLMFPLGEGMILDGWALVAHGQGEAGLTHIRQGIATYRATGATLSLPVWQGFLAEAYGKVGQPEQGLPIVTEALAVVEETGARAFAAELYRLKGTLALQAELSTEVAQAVEEDFWQAIAIARQQQAKSLELRAAMSLARLWQQQGKRAEARALLAPIYGWFTEGFDTADLLEAKALLAELA